MSWVWRTSRCRPIHSTQLNSTAVLLWVRCLLRHVDSTSGSSHTHNMTGSVLSVLYTYYLLFDVMSQSNIWLCFLQLPPSYFSSETDCMLCEGRCKSTPQSQIRLCLFPHAARVALNQPAEWLLVCSLLSSLFSLLVSLEQIGILHKRFKLLSNNEETLRWTQVSGYRDASCCRIHYCLISPPLSQYHNSTGIGIPCRYLI